MGRAAKPTKTKEPIRLRIKSLANGNKSIYLDTYRDGLRRKEYLKLYIVPERTAIDKANNKKTIQQAEFIKAQRMLELASVETGLPVTNRCKMLLSDYMALFYNEQVKLQKQWLQQCKNAIKLLGMYCNSRTTLKDVTPDFCRGFIEYLSNEYTTARGTHLTNYAIKNYLGVLSCALNMAVRQNYIEINPLTKLSTAEIPQKPESQRIYLTLEELKRMETAECGNLLVKQAYLFSCYCGLRISDIKRLKWANVEQTSEGMRLAITQKKTKRTLYVPLSKKAVSYLPPKENGSSLVFGGLCNIGNINKNLKKWAKGAGVNKLVTFHTARHTFATTLLTLGADLYTTSKLMGHTEVRTTQIYAKIVDAKKVQAVSLLDNI